jgi:acyl-CoA synthetase (AMP-forming)/AMP-acid ligase II
VSELVAALGRVHTTDPRRSLIHLPATGTVLNASDVWALHLRFAEQLRAAGLQPGQVVVAAAGNRPGYIALLVACRTLALVLVPVDVSATTAEILELAHRMMASALVTTDGAVALGTGPSTALGTGRPVPIGDDLFLAAREAPASAAVQAPFGHEAALMKLTSGSSGTPKATLTTEAQLIADSRQIIAGMQIGPDDTQIAAIPLSHAYGLSVVLMPMLLQGTPIVLRQNFVPAQLPADAQAAGARIFAGVPFMFQHFVAHPPAGGWPVGLGKLISAGAPLLPETARDFIAAFGVKIHSFYGTSETGGIAYDSVDLDSSDELTVDGAIGPLLPGVAVELVAEADLPPRSGRILVRSAAVSSGYAGGPDPAFRDSGFLTGDYGRFDERGRLVLTGRASSFINVAGRKVEPGEVERVLRLMPGVRDAHVGAAADPQRGEQVVAYVAARGDMTALGVRQFCAAHLAAHKIPRLVLFVDAVPRTVRGKVDRPALDAILRNSLAIDASSGLPTARQEW